MRLQTSFEDKAEALLVVGAHAFCLQEITFLKESVRMPRMCPKPAPLEAWMV